MAEKAADRNAGILAAVMAQFGQQASGSSLRAAWKSDTIPQLFSAFEAPENRQVNYDFEGGKGSMTMAQAKANFEAAEKQSEATAATVRAAEDARRDARERATSAKKEAGDLGRDVAGREASLTILQKTGPQIAEAEMAKDAKKGEKK